MPAALVLVALEEQDVVLLIGSDIRHEQPLACHRIRKAALHGAQVIAINPIDYEFNFPVTKKIIVGVWKKCLNGQFIKHFLF